MKHWLAKPHQTEPQILHLKQTKFLWDSLRKFSRHNDLNDLVFWCLRCQYLQGKRQKLLRLFVPSVFLPPQRLLHSCSLRIASSMESTPRTFLTTSFGESAPRSF